MRSQLLSILLLAAACSDDGGSSPADAATSCTGALYDPCMTNDQCTGMNCRLFTQDQLQICTQSCTPGDNSTCPTQDGVTVSCNNMGVCKPPAATSCTR